MMSSEYDECVEIMAYAVTTQNVEDINHLLLLQTPDASPLSLQDIVEDIQSGSSFIIATHNKRIVGLRVLFHQGENRTGEKGLSEEIMVHEDYEDIGIANDLSEMGKFHDQTVTPGFARDPYTSRGWELDSSGIYRKSS